MLAQQCLHPGQIFAGFAKTLERFGLPGGHLKAEAENLLGQLLVLGLQLVDARLTDFFDATRHDQSAPARVTNLVGIGSLCAASPRASRAVASSMPPSSNMIRPGSTTATQRSGAPLPLPMRVSAGFLVKGLSGKMRMNSLPPRLVKREIATREASIWRSVIQAASRAFRPYSPNASSLPRQDLPLRRPRICLRYFTFLGINIACSLFLEFLTLLPGSFRDPFALSGRAWERSRPDTPSTSHRSLRTWCSLRRCRNRCPRAGSAAADDPADTTLCARFPRRSDGRLREL